MIDAPLGVLRASAELDALTGLWFAGQKYFPENAAAWTEKPDYPVFESLRAWAVRYFAGENPPPEIPLNPSGTDFQRKVWECLARIPYGETRTYGEIAGQIHSRSPQAVGGAIGRNPISLLIPCHRVIGSDGGLTGYAGGLYKKRELLALEGHRFMA
jgi:methylated-DNA-[protein]-cysteine S-methyltransferase